MRRASRSAPCHTTTRARSSGLRFSRSENSRPRRPSTAPRRSGLSGPGTFSTATNAIAATPAAIVAAASRRRRCTAGQQRSTSLATLVAALPGAAAACRSQGHQLGGGRHAVHRETRGPSRVAVTAPPPEQPRQRQREGEQQVLARERVAPSVVEMRHSWNVTCCQSSGSWPSRCRKPYTHTGRLAATTASSRRSSTAVVAGREAREDRQMGEQRHQPSSRT